MTQVQQNEKLLVIEPANELRFVGPFHRPVVTLMTLKNTTDQFMVFKIKTTAPKRYCVRPNIGKIPPFKSTQVEICLQPFIYDPNEKNKHKFMVQSVFATENADLTDLNKLWKDLEPEQLMDAKLKCVFEMPTTVTALNADTSGSANTELVKEDAKVYSEEKTSNLPVSDQTESLVNELQYLNDENSALRKEIVNLKEQVIRYRTTKAKSVITEPFTPVVMAEKQIPVFFIAIAIAAGILGILLGKFLL